MRQLDLTTIFEKVRVVVVGSAFPTDDYDEKNNIVMSSLSEDAKQTLKRLLDKAGNDPRLTPRILREKAEQKLHLETGTCKNFLQQPITIITVVHYR